MIVNSIASVRRAHWVVQEKINKIHKKDTQSYWQKAINWLTWSSHSLVCAKYELSWFAEWGQLPNHFFVAYWSTSLRWIVGLLECCRIIIGSLYYSLCACCLVFSTWSIDYSLFIVREVSIALMDTICLYNSICVCLFGCPIKDI